MLCFGITESLLLYLYKQCRVHRHLIVNQELTIKAPPGSDVGRQSANLMGGALVVCGVANNIKRIDRARGAERPVQAALRRRAQVCRGRICETRPRPVSGRGRIQTTEAAPRLCAYIRIIS